MSIKLLNFSIKIMHKRKKIHDRNIKDSIPPFRKYAKLVIYIKSNFHFFLIDEGDEKLKLPYKTKFFYHQNVNHIPFNFQEKIPLDNVENCLID